MLKSTKGRYSVNLAYRLVHQSAEHLGEPPLHGGKGGQNHRCEYHVVEVGNHEVSVVQLYIGHRCAQLQAREATDDKYAVCEKCVQKRCVEPQRPAPQGQTHSHHDDQERHGYDDGGDAEAYGGQRVQSGHEHMVRPHHEAEYAGENGGVDNVVVAVQGLSSPRRGISHR